MARTHISTASALYLFCWALVASSVVSDSVDEIPAPGVANVHEVPFPDDQTQRVGSEVGPSQHLGNVPAPEVVENPIQVPVANDKNKGVGAEVPPTGLEVTVPEVAPRKEEVPTPKDTGNEVGSEGNPTEDQLNGANVPGVSDTSKEVPFPEKQDVRVGAEVGPDGDVTQVPEVVQREEGGVPAVKRSSDVGAEVPMTETPVPDAFLSPFGSYPNVLAVSDSDLETFHPVVLFPKDVAVEVIDCQDAVGLAAESEIAAAKKRDTFWGRLSRRIRQYLKAFKRLLLGQQAAVAPPNFWQVGRYDENRISMYTSEHFQDLEYTIDGFAGLRTVHLGIDLGGPVGTPVHAFTNGVVHSVGYNADLGDYGYVVVIEHTLPSSLKVWALYGHLDRSTVQRCRGPGQPVRAGQVVGKLGDIHENGGWKGPHVHFQLSLSPPDTHDMPGASSEADRARALLQYPDPRYIVFGLQVLVPAWTCATTFQVVDHLDLLGLADSRARVSLNQQRKDEHKTRKNLTKPKMRRSKSDPAKYARNYRKISQRRMTQYDHIDEDKEIERLRAILRDSEAHLQSSHQAGDNGAESKPNKRKRNHEKGKTETTEMEGENSALSMLSSELQEEALAAGDDNALVILPSKKKKIKQSRVQLTPEEIREATLLQKKTAKKLQQLEARAAQKKQRAEIYKRLEQHRVSDSTLDLLNKSGNVSRKDIDTKKQTLQKLVRKEKAGIELTEEEKDLLYPERGVPDDLPVAATPVAGSSAKPTPAQKAEKSSKKRKKSQQTKFHPGNMGDEPEPKPTKIDPPPRPDPEVSDSSSDEEETKNTSNQRNESAPSNPVLPVKAASSGFDFASQMMASLSKLKQDSSQYSGDSGKAKKTLADMSEELPVDEKYVPSDPTILKSAAALGIPAAETSTTRRVVTIKRPEAVEKSRFDLPVSAMEFEIMDAIRNNDVTIICGETGSGKSTQVPQFIYEAGMCAHPRHPDRSFLVGITQPRRVAAVSTAKRVCFEMGCGDGQTIKSSGAKGNLVSYCTRYETAGVGSRNRVQFMTDGILLQEIQNDLLLRRYSVIVLDESHERNLNTDVLIGMLSVAIPLRKKAAEEDKFLVPLKLVLMSATLRVEDFTKNERLFKDSIPAVVNVPGRTHPVTIHHSKVTEIDDYESAAFKKICRIHRKLPQGGILVFLTGKGEIIRMVNRLRKALNPKTTRTQPCTSSSDVSEGVGLTTLSGPREMDDEELDAEGSIIDDFDDIDDDPVERRSQNEEPSDDDNIPQEALVLPLYSLLSADEQAKVFAPIPEGQRLVVIATNIAETSITIPGISYVVDTGRQKCRNYNSGTGVASYDVMWISKAAADQRAGRAGRTGPGHCYRLFSSSLYSRHMDQFALPEVLTRPLEDVVLAMKALRVTDVSNFPFPTPPSRDQINSAVKLLAHIGCIDTSNVEKEGGDGVATKLGVAVSKLPLGARYGKMLLVAAQAGVLDYAIVAVSVLSENSPFQQRREDIGDNEDGEEENKDDEDSMDDIDKQRAEELSKLEARNKKRWHHRGGDILSSVLAVGAYTYAGKDAGGVAEKIACQKFCEENGLNPVIMERVQKMRIHLAHLAKNRLRTAEGVAATTGGYSSKMTPPNKLQERLLLQAIASGLLDNVALRAPPGSVNTDHPFGIRSAYISSSSSSSSDPLFMDKSSSLFSKDFRQLPQWICYDGMVRKTLKDGTPVKVMKGITLVDPSWLGDVAKGTDLLALGAPLKSPPPIYDMEDDVVLCSVTTKFGYHRWEIPPIKKVMYDYLQTSEAKQSAAFVNGDSFKWFGRFLLEGKVFSELSPFGELLNDKPTIITANIPSAKASALVSGLSGAGVDSASALVKHWAEKDDKFLFKLLKKWVKQDRQTEAKKLWIETVKHHVSLYKATK
eukprot:Nitzschia sp. Nitz4//scaffold39_size137210//9590//15393//NITZ4_003183-RA/size137210-snap-gene-0.131-mRNA-1//1//CDS//3329550335//8599//frame0